MFHYVFVNKHFIMYIDINRIHIYFFHYSLLTNLQITIEDLYTSLDI